MMQVSATPPTVTFMVVPASPSVVGNGNLFGADVKAVGPRPVPLTMNIEPWAIPELTSPGGSQPAALVIPKMTGAAADVAAQPKTRTVRFSRRMVFLRIRVFRTFIILYSAIDRQKASLPGKKAWMEADWMEAV